MATNAPACLFGVRRSLATTSRSTPDACNTGGLDQKSTGQGDVCLAYDEWPWPASASTECTDHKSNSSPYPALLPISKHSITGANSSTGGMFSWRQMVPSLDTLSDKQCNTRTTYNGKPQVPCSAAWCGSMSVIGSDVVEGPHLVGSSGRSQGFSVGKASDIGVSDGYSETLMECISTVRQAVEEMYMHQQGADVVVRKFMPADSCIMEALMSDTAVIPVHKCLPPIKVCNLLQDSCIRKTHKHGSLCKALNRGALCRRHFLVRASKAASIQYNPGGEAD
jgi:hypothetical protein